MEDSASDRFVRLLLRHEQDLLRYVLPLIGGNLEDARDVVQDAAVTLWQKFADYDPAQPFLPWARQFARYTALMHHRKRRRYTFLSEELLAQLADDPPDEERLSGRRRQALETCLEQIPPADRELLEHRYREPGCTIQQVAAGTKQSPNVLYKALARIRQRLMICIDRRLAAEEGV